LFLSNVNNGWAGGVIVVGEQTISYHSMTWDSLECIVAQPTIFECCTSVDSEGSSEEWILGDAEGRIYSLSLSSNDITITKLGEVLVSLSVLSSRPNVGLRSPPFPPPSSR